MSAKFLKIFNINCIMLKNQALECNHCIDPDEMAHYEPSHLDLQCLQIQLLLSLALYGLTAPCSQRRYQVLFFKIIVWKALRVPQ